MKKWIIGLSIATILAVAAALVFFSLRADTFPITKEDAVFYQGTVVEVNAHYSRRGGRSGRYEVDRIDLVFEDGCEYTIGKGIATSTMEYELVYLKGDEVSLLYNEKAGTVMELTREGRVYVSFSQSLKALESLGITRLIYAITALVIAAALLGCDGYLIFHAIRQRNVYRTVFR